MILGRKRTGALAVEAAIVLPVMFFLLIGLVLGGVAVFHHQQVAHLAREASRWASVRGSEWSRETGEESPSAEDIRKIVVLPKSAAMEPDRLQVEVLWINGATGASQAWDSSPKSTRSLTVAGEYVPNRVRVTVRYDWLGGSLFGTIRLESSSEVPLTY